MKFPASIEIVAQASLRDHALDQIAYIRSAMERAGAFTAIPGAGGVWMGVTALAAAAAAWCQETAEDWLRVWMAEAVLAALIGGWMMYRKARRAGTSLRSEPGRKFALGFLPPLAAAALLTPSLYGTGRLKLVVATWLLLYGAAVTASGAFSQRIVPALGLSFFGAGLLALIVPEAWRDLPMAFGFGGLHILFGVLILRRYGG